VISYLRLHFILPTFTPSNSQNKKLTFLLGMDTGWVGRGLSKPITQSIQFSVDQVCHPTHIFTIKLEQNQLGSQGVGLSWVCSLCV